jgi:HK97 family phage portal protein
MIRLGLSEWMRSQPVQKRAITLSDFPWLQERWGEIGINSSGASVTEESALTFSAYWNAVDIIASSVASLPRITYRRLSDVDTERATAHPAYRVLHDAPNPRMTPFVFWQTFVGHILTWGNGYAEIEFDRALRPIALWPIAPRDIAPKVVRGKLVYLFRGRDEIPASDIFHVPGLGFDGLIGYSVVGMARKSIGLALATEQFGASFFGQGAWPGVVAETDQVLKDPAVRDRIRDSWNALHQGPDKAHRLAVLEGGLKLNKLTIPPDDAQFLETRQLQIEEIARWLNIPPHKLKLKVGERPGGNLESSQIEFLTDCLRPWLIRVEQEANRKLMSPPNYCEHLVDAILRADSATRRDSYKAYFEMGVLDAEQIAKLENLPKPKPRPDLAPAPAPAADKQDGGARMLAAQRALTMSTVHSFVKIESNEARRAAKKGPEQFQSWVAQFYQRKGDVLRSLLSPLVEHQLARLGVTGDAGAMAGVLAGDYLERSRDDLLDLRAADLEGEVQRLVERWQLMRPVEMADMVSALGAGGGNDEA